MILFGRDIKIFMDGVAIAAAKSCEISINVDTHTVATPADTEWLRLKAERYEWTVQVSTLVTEVRTRFNLGQMVTLTMAVCDANGMTADRLSGTAYLQKSEISAQLGNLVQGGFTFQGVVPLLPMVYDSKIEYLESSGTQYIDSGINYDFSKNIQIKCGIVPINNNRIVVAGNYTGDSAGLSLELGGTSNNAERKPRFYMTLTQSSNSSSLWNNALTLNTSYEITINYNVTSHIKTLVSNGETNTETYSGTTYGNQKNILFFLDYRTNKTAIANPARITFAQIYLDNIIVRDYIPVRNRQVGYLYDKITNTLFGNDGIGSFTLGPDKV